MAIRKTTSLYEILFRFKLDGSYGGAHAQYRKVITENGVVIADTLGDDIPLSLIAEGDKATVAAVLGEAMTAMVTAKEAAEAEVASLRAEVQAKDATAQSLLARVAELEGKPAA